ncbi:MAG TPA: hypothetical protein VIS49_00325 [Cyclobacteriaceae bacterium]
MILSGYPLFQQLGNIKYKNRQMIAIDWKKEIKPLIKKYKGKQHPLDHHHIPYELLVMVVLSAQDSDRNINKIAPELFEAFPDMQALAKADFDTLFLFI